MNLRSVDLNLLVVLDALLDERHVSRAADRVGLSQPAASAALQRCRHLFRDELLERGRRSMRLTAKGESLRAPLKALLASATDLIDPPEIPLAEIETTMRLVMADLPALLEIEPLLVDLAGSSPGIDIVLQPWHGVDAAKRALTEGSTDIAVSVFAGAEDELRRETVGEETYVVVMRDGHPAASDLTLDRWLAFPHVVVSGLGEARTPLDVELARRGLARRVGLVVPSFGMVPPVLRSTSMIAMLPTRMAKTMRGLATFPPPIPAEGFTLSLVWHRRRERDRALRHVAHRLAAFLR
ncbi:LysR family transcriptional regulator [Aurantimonas aggregata]|uniref:LysR family transcriptional regulator n=1 Tax=Aurantimonas aggregata TaxID=2047720 RepID=A0A6L9MPD0_9HYPH|nr:LysR family transcriptional regulator [Aurantimonas aggregata]NDV89400.1 LysR family transcriptional regulator [Aurantimonas aggregata]